MTDAQLSIPCNKRKKMKKSNRVIGDDAKLLHDDDSLTFTEGASSFFRSPHNVMQYAVLRPHEISLGF